MTCQHPPCTCQATTNSPYCSAHCASHATSTSGRCGCGHPDCVSQAVTA